MTVGGAHGKWLCGASELLRLRNVVRRFRQVADGCVPQSAAVTLGLLEGHVRHRLIGGHGVPSDPNEHTQELMGAVGRMVSR